MVPRGGKVPSWFVTEEGKTHYTIVQVSTSTPAPLRGGETTSHHQALGCPLLKLRTKQEAGQRQTQRPRNTVPSLRSPAGPVTAVTLEPPAQ